MRIVISNTAQNRSFLIFAPKDLKIDTEVFIDDIPIPTLDASQTYLMNFGGITRNIIVTFTLADGNPGEIGSAFNGDLSLGTNDQMVMPIVPDGSGNLDQLTYLNTYFPTTNPSDNFTLSLTDDNFPPGIAISFTGLISFFEIDLIAGTRLGDASITFEQGQNIAS